MACVLIADDDPTVRLIVSELLTPAGHQVLEAGDGAQAVKTIAAGGVDLLILDMFMPNKDGLETIMEIRAAGQALKILAISSGRRGQVSELLRTAVLFGADASLSKPLNLRTFAATVEDLLGRRPITASPSPPPKP